MAFESKLSMLSQNELNSLLFQVITFEDALRYLNEELQVRTFTETVSAFSNLQDERDLRRYLNEGLCDIETSLGTTANSESISRNSRNWFSGKTLPDRDNCIKICFALGLPEQASKAFMMFATEEGFHFRNPQDLAILFGLRTQMNYAEALSLFHSMKPVTISTKPDCEPVFTKTVEDAFAQVYDRATFLQFYEESYAALGNMRNTAYYKCFMPFIDTLICPQVSDYFEKERKYSVEEVVDHYLRMHIPLEKSTAKYAVLQRTIRKYWPNTASIIRMRNRTENVTRKILLLLYLVTGGHQSNEREGYTYDDLCDTEQFEAHFWKLNAMLSDCGFSLLDPRNMFDWLILYCLKVGEDELMSERLQGLLSRVFPETI